RVTDHQQAQGDDDEARDRLPGRPLEEPDGRGERAEQREHDGESADEQDDRQDPTRPRLVGVPRHPPLDGRGAGHERQEAAHHRPHRPRARRIGRDAELAPQAPWRRRLPTHRWVPVGARMPFTKTEVDIHDDYVVESVDPAWLAQGVKSPKYLMLDPDNCILCRACEDVCPWNCIWMMSTDIVRDADE